MKRFRSIHALAVTAVCVSALYLVGCGYHYGSLMHPQVRSIAVGDVVNATGEPELGPLLQKQLSEEIARDGAVRLASRASADAVIHARVVDVSLAGAASARLREKEDRNEDREAYQTTLYTATVTLEVMLAIPGREAPAVAWRKVSGEADFMRVSDLAGARSDGLQQATKNAVTNAITAITEAW